MLRIILIILSTLSATASEEKKALEAIAEASSKYEAVKNRVNKIKKVVVNSTGISEKTWATTLSVSAMAVSQRVDTTPLNLTINIGNLCIEPSIAHDISSRETKGNLSFKINY